MPFNTVLSVSPLLTTLYGIINLSTTRLMLHPLLVMLTMLNRSGLMMVLGSMLPPLVVLMHYSLALTLPLLLPSIDGGFFTVRNRIIALSMVISHANLSCTYVVLNALVLYTRVHDCVHLDYCHNSDVLVNLFLIHCL